MLELILCATPPQSNGVRLMAVVPVCVGPEIAVWSRVAKPPDVSRETGSAD